MEATGPYWYGIYDTLSDNGINVVLVNPASTKALMGNKTDKIDSNRLATLLTLNQLVPSYVPDRETRNLRRLTRLERDRPNNGMAAHNKACAARIPDPLEPFPKAPL